MRSRDCAGSDMAPVGAAQPQTPLRALATLAIVAMVALALYWFRRDLETAVVMLRARLTWPLFAGIAALTLLHFANEPLRWWLLLRRHQPAVSFSRTYHALAATALVNYAFPARLGMPVRVFMAKRVIGLEYATTAALMLIDAVFYYGLWMAAAIAGASAIAPAVQRPLLWGGVAVAAGALVLFGWRLAAKRFEVAKRLQVGARMLSPAVGMWNAGLVSVDVVAYGLRHVLILMAPGWTGSALPVIGAVAIGTVAGFVSLMPLGLGAYDLSLAFVLTGLGVPREAAVAVPVINRLATIVAGIALGTISMLRVGLRPLGALRKARLDERERAT